MIEALYNIPCTISVTLEVQQIDRCTVSTMVLDRPTRIHAPPLHFNVLFGLDFSERVCDPQFLCVFLHFDEKLDTEHVFRLAHIVSKSVDLGWIEIKRLEGVGSLLNVVVVVVVVD